MENLTFAEELANIDEETLQDLENMAIDYNLGKLYDIVLAEVRRRSDPGPLDELAQGRSHSPAHMGQ